MIVINYPCIKFTIKRQITFHTLFQMNFIIDFVIANYKNVFEVL